MENVAFCGIRHLFKEKLRAMNRLKDFLILTFYFLGGLIFFKYLSCLISQEDYHVRIFHNIFVAAGIAVLWVFVYPLTGINGEK